MKIIESPRRGLSNKAQSFACQDPHGQERPGEETLDEEDGPLHEPEEKFE